MTTAEDDVAGTRREHTWEGDASQVFHCTTCGLVTTSTDTHFTCRPRPAAGAEQDDAGG